MSEGNRDTYAEFKRNTLPYASRIVPIRGMSTDVVDRVAQQAPSIDLLFIDGDHSYEGAKADWESYKHLLKDGSTVVFHDIGWAEGVQRVVREDVQPRVASHGSLPNMWWGVLKH
jgi:predicted O-methyltransferase YrrM